MIGKGIQQTFNQHVNRSREASPFREGERSPRNPSPVMAEDCGNCVIPIPIQNIGCQDLLELKCTHCGWLRKRRTLSLFSWPQAYVVLHEGCLYYFKNEKSRAPAGKFSMYGYNSIYRASEILPKEAPWCFKIVHSHSKEFKSYFFSASSEQEMKIWMRKIKEEMLHANGKSDLYGRNLPHVKEEKPDKMLDDPSFYQNIEENVYDDTSKFVPSHDYQKQCSIKRINEDSDDEDIEPNPSIDTRPPQPLPKDKGPFMISNNSDFTAIDSPPVPPFSKPPLKPPRIVENKPPAVPPPVRKNPPPEPPGSSESLLDTADGSGLSRIKKIALEVEQQIENKRSRPLPLPVSPKPTRIKRRGSYEPTDGPGNKSPSVARHGVPVVVPDGSGGGSTGSDDQQSDLEEEWLDIYFDKRDKQQANEILQKIGEDGVFLVRPENVGDGMVLVVFVKDHSRKYRIMYEHGEYFIHREHFRHKSLEMLIRHYYENNLPTMSLMLKVPYKLHPAYKSLNL